MFCTNCGKEINVNLNYCTNCGFEIKKAEALPIKTTKKGLLMSIFSLVCNFISTIYLYIGFLILLIGLGASAINPDGPNTAAVKDLFLKITIPPLALCIVAITLAILGIMKSKQEKRKPGVILGIVSLCLTPFGLLLAFIGF